MSPLKFTFVSLATYGIVGPLVPTLLMIFPAMFTNSGGLGLFAFLIAPTAYVFGGQAAVLSGTAFVALIIIAVRLQAARRLNGRIPCTLAGGGTGALAALPWLVELSVQPWLFFFLAPSLVCGALLGLFVLPRLTATMLLSPDAQKVRTD